MNPQLSEAVVAAVAGLTKRQRGLLKAVLIDHSELAEIAKNNLVSNDIVDAWIADARQRLSDGIAIHLRRFGLYDDAINALLGDTAQIAEALAGALAETKRTLPSWLRDMDAARIYWTGPFSYRSFKEDTKYHNRTGLYQIRARHPSNGPDTLIYVGCADKLVVPLADHWSQWMSDEQRVRIFIGELSREDSTSSKLLADAAALTIYWHSPAYNSANIAAYAGRRLIVQNLGQRGSLLPMYSSDWPSGRPEF